MRRFFLLLILSLPAHAELHEIAGSLTLDSLVDSARHDNATLRAARAKAAAMSERPAQEKAWPNPMFKYGAMDTTTRGNLADAGEKRFMVEQPFLWFGKRDLRARIVGQEAATLHQEAAAMEREVIMQVQETYYDLYAVQRVLQLVHAEEALLGNLLTAAENLYTTGVRTQTDVIKAQAEITMLQQKIIEQEQQAATLKAHLNQLLNRDPDSPLGLAVIPPPRRTFLPQTGERPEIKAAKIELDRSRLQRDLMQKEFFTDYRVGVEYRNFRAGDDMVMFTFSFDLPIWQNKYKAGVRETERLMESSAAVLTAVRQQTAFEAADARYKITAAQRTLALYEKTLIPQAETRLKASDAAYRTGKGDFMDLLETERFLLNARTMAALAEGNLGVQLARLERAASGELPKPEEIK